MQTPFPHSLSSTSYYGSISDDLLKSNEIFYSFSESFENTKNISSEMESKINIPKTDNSTGKKSTFAEKFKGLFCNKDFSISDSITSDEYKEKFFLNGKGLDNLGADSEQIVAKALTYDNLNLKSNRSSIPLIANHTKLNEDIIDAYKIWFEVTKNEKCDALAHQKAALEVLNILKKYFIKGDDCEFTAKDKYTKLLLKSMNTGIDILKNIEKNAAGLIKDNTENIEAMKLERLFMGEIDSVIEKLIKELEPYLPTDTTNKVTELKDFFKQLWKLIKISSCQYKKEFVVPAISILLGGIITLAIAASPTVAIGTASSLVIGLLGSACFDAYARRGNVSSLTTLYETLKEISYLIKGDLIKIDSFIKVKEETSKMTAAQ